MSSPISRGFRGLRRAPAGQGGRPPPGHYLTEDFPVLSAGPTPHTAGELDVLDYARRRHQEVLDLAAIPARRAPSARRRSISWSRRVATST